MRIASVHGHLQLCTYCKGGKEEGSMSSAVEFCRQVLKEGGIWWDQRAQLKILPHFIAPILDAWGFKAKGICCCCLPRYPMPRCSRLCLFVDLRHCFAKKLRWEVRSGDGRCCRRESRMTEEQGGKGQAATQKKYKKTFDHTFVRSKTQRHHIVETMLSSRSRASSFLRG